MVGGGFLPTLRGREGKLAVDFLDEIGAALEFKQRLRKKLTEVFEREEYRGKARELRQLCGVLKVSSGDLRDSMVALRGIAAEVGRAPGISTEGEAGRVLQEMLEMEKRGEVEGVGESMMRARRVVLGRGEEVVDGADR